MTDPRSPIARMIDEACGFDPAKPPPPDPLRVVMRCPCCKREATYSRRPSKRLPEGTQLIEIPCPKCQTYPFKITVLGAGDRILGIGTVRRKP